MSLVNKPDYLDIDIKSKLLIEAAYRVTDTKSSTTNYHYHNGYEIFQVWSPDGSVLVEEKSYPVRPGYIYIVNSLELHCVRPVPNSPYIRSKVTFSPIWVRSLLQQMDQLYLLDPFMNKGKGFSHNIIPDKQMEKRIDDLFKQMALENSRKSVGQMAFLWAYLIEMLGIIYRWYNRNQELFPPLLSTTHTHIQKAMDYIDRNISSNITIEDICRNLHLSKYYICHLFKENTGMTIMDYIQKKRVAEAKRLLLLSDRPISQIAMDAGFNSFSVFSRVFKEMTGYSPSTFRKMYSAKIEL